MQPDSDSESEDTADAATQKGKRKMTKSGKSKVKEASAAGMKESPVKASYCHWLMKSEPESRFENGIDVKVAYVSCWD